MWRSDAGVAVLCVPRSWLVTVSSSGHWPCARVSFVPPAALGLARGFLRGLSLVCTAEEGEVAVSPPESCACHG